MSQFAISAVNLSKQYRLGAKSAGYRTFRESLGDLARWPAKLWRARSNPQPAEKIWALKDISFEIKPGEAVGVIGRNGAGKSTLLKILSRVTEPCRGYADIRGRVGSLLEVGTGFHPELTGRENTFLSGAILGMGRQEMERKFDAIVDFSEVGQFIDTAVKHYSSGMYLRLAFAVAAHLEPEILLVDEVLAVGDMAFQRKCLEKMKTVGSRGQTVVFVSHDLSVVSRLATSSLVLEKGQIGFYGPTEEAIKRYSSHPVASDSLAERHDRVGDGLLRFESLQFLDRYDCVADTVASGDRTALRIKISSQLKQVELEDVALDIRFTDTLGHPVTTFSTRFAGGAVGSFQQEAILQCQIPSLSLSSAQYGVDLWMSYRGGTADFVTQAGQLQVVPSDYYGTGQEPVQRKHGAALINHSWCVS